MKAEIRPNGKSMIEKWRSKYLWFKALMFILIGDKDIVFKTPLQKSRSSPKITHKTSPTPTKTNDGDKKHPEPMKIKRYY